jgi:hypothetical protein
MVLFPIVITIPPFATERIQHLWSPGKSITTLTVTTPTTRLVLPPRANHMTSNIVD